MRSWRVLARGLTIPIAASAALLAMPAITAPAQPGAHAIPANLMAAGPWLNRLNQWRGVAGLATVSENTTWSQGDYDHGLYMVKNDLVTHYETPGVAYYTVAGDTAARNSNIEVNSTTAFSDEQAIDWWMRAPFHALGMMDPRLQQVGFGAYREVKSGWQAGFALDDLRGNSFTGGSYPVYFPGNGSTEPMTSYTGGEFPDPLQACAGYTVPTGLPVFIEVGGNVKTTVGAVHSFTGNGVDLAHCVIDSNNSAVGSYLTPRGGVILVPRQPLLAGVQYRVSLTVNGTAYSWSFTVGPFAGCTSVTGSSSPASPAAIGVPVTFTASASGCINPVYQFWMLAPGTTTWQVAQPYSSSPTFAWSTAGRLSGAYRITAWARDANSTGNLRNVLGSWDASWDGLFTLTGSRCAAVTSTLAPASPRAVGTAVSLAASATGCPSPRYQFWILAAGSSTWQIAQPYSPTATFNWNTSGLKTGTYRLTVWARDATSSGTFTNVLGGWDASSDAVYVLTSPCGSAGDVATPGSPSVHGTTVVFTATSTGCPGPLYQFWMLAPGSSTWVIVQPYSTAATLQWNTTGKVAGTYRVTVWVRDASSTGVNHNTLGGWDTSNDGLYALT